METESKLPIKRYLFFQISLVVSILEGVIVLFFLFSDRSEFGSNFLFGYSLRRLLIGGMFFIILALLTTLLIGIKKSTRFLPSFGKKLVRILQIETVYVLFQATLGIVLAFTLEIILVGLFPETQRLVPFVKDISLFQLMTQQGGLIIIWLCLVTYKMIILNRLYSQPKAGWRLTFPARATIVLWTVLISLIIAVLLERALGRTGNGDQFLDITWKILVLSVWFSLWTYFTAHTRRQQISSGFFEAASIWLVTFLVSMQVAQWFNGLVTPADNYFNLLAESILHGKLSLINPQITFDLTSNHGQWYVPFPPMPAILLLPFIAVLGVSGVNTVIFSLIIASTTTMLVFFIVKDLSRLQSVQAPVSAAAWMAALFHAGTVHMWLSITSRSWHFSQVCTVFFCALAFFCCLRKFPAWIVGLCLAAAILSRPNVIVLWPALVAIQIQFDQQGLEAIRWKRIFRWSMWSAIPVIASVGILLVYNYLRFGSFMDFGYTTISGSEWTVSRAQAYGMFNPHFIPFNLYWMFAAFLPRLIAECSYYLPRGNGMSLFIATPALIYLFRRFKVNWLNAGCWVSIILSITLLAMYHNNGANQISYRYLMDFIIPAIMLLAFNAGRRISIPLKILILISIVISYYGIISWYRGPC